MRVIVHVSSYYDHHPVPSDVQVTQESIDAGRVIPGRHKGDWRMKVLVPQPSYVEIGISEGALIARIIDQAMVRNGSRTMSRKEAVDYEVTVRHLPMHAHTDHVEMVEVHDDGPDKDLFINTVKPYLEAMHPQTASPLISAAMYDRLLTAYLEPVDAGGHRDHLHARLHVKAKVQQ